MIMKQFIRNTSSHQAGFSLVEIMVGMAIGLLATLVIVQVLSTFETQKRSTTGTADAQTNGSIAIFNITREMKMAGYPLPPIENSAFECTTLTLNGAADDPSNLSPVTIIDGGPGGSDTITIRYGNSAAGGIPSAISAMVGNTATLGSNLGCKTGDTTLITNGTVCAVSTATAVPAADAAGPAINNSLTLQDITAASVGAKLACIGNWTVNTYSIIDRNLYVTSNGVATPSMEGIVDLQAQYGISAAGNSNTIAQWVEPTGTWDTPSVDDRNRIKAVRLAVVARNPKKEPAEVTKACSADNTPGLTGLCAWEGDSTSPAPVIDLTASDADWLKYRYRVFETVIPLRNIIWSRSTL
jgi:type IV pilus assembly protein PilW